MRTQTLQTGILPLKRKSRLLAPIEKVKLPFGFRQPCASASHTLKSYRDSVSVTVSLWCGFSSTSEKPRRTLGGSPALDGKWRYSCGICSYGKRHDSCNERRKYSRNSPHRP